MKEYYANRELCIINYLSLQEVTNKQIKISIRNSELFKVVRESCKVGTYSSFTPQIFNKTYELLQKYKQANACNELDTFLLILDDKKSINDLSKEEISNLYTFLEINSESLPFISIIKPRKYPDIVKQIEDTFKKQNEKPTNVLYDNNPEDCVISDILIKVNQGLIKKENVSFKMLLNFEKINKVNLVLKTSRGTRLDVLNYQNYLKSINYCDNYNNTDEEIYDEMKFVKDCVTKDDFKEKYHHNYDIIDFYLTTLLRISDIQKHYNKNNMQVIDFIRSQYQKAFVMKNPTLKFYEAYENYTYGHEFLGDLDFKSTTSEKITYTDEEFALVQKYLLRLNMNYGVKIDKVSICAMINAVKGNYVHEYFKVAKDYKEKLDKKSKICETINPLVRRRVNL